MKNFIHEGNMVTVAAPSGGVVSGAGVLVGSIFGVAAFSAGAGDPVELATTGVYDLAKATGGALTVGQAVFFDNTAKKVTGTATGNTLVGVATAAASSDAVIGRVRLNGHFGGASAADITALDARVDVLEAE